MSDLIDLIPVELIEDIGSGECLPIIGAGLSRNALVPPKCQMPLWDDLGIECAKRLGLNSSGKTVELLSCYCDRYGKLELARLLRRALHINTARPADVHAHFVALPFKHVLTTNFDFLIERAYEMANKSCLPVVDEELLGFGRPDGEIRLVKMHGDLHHPSLMVVTESDYDGFRDQHEAMFFEVTSLLSHHSVLFMGYSIDDPDFRQIWRLVDIHLKGLRRPAYTLLVGATDEQTERYRRRGVKAISLPGTAKVYGKTLAEALRQIGTATRTATRKKQL